MGSDQRADEEAIRELLRRQLTSWEASDAEGYASVFTADADYVTFLGTHHTGRDAIAASYTPLFKRLLKGTRLQAEIAKLRFLTPDVTLIQTHAAVIRGARRRPRRAARVSISIAVRTDDGWLLAASQNTTHRRLTEKLMGRLVPDSLTGEQDGPHA